MPGIQIEFEFTADDFKEAVRAFQRHLRSARSVRQGRYVALVALDPLFLKRMEPSTSVAFVAVGAVLILFGIFPGYFPLASRRAFATQEQMQGRFRVEFSEDGVTATGPHSRGEMGWTLLDKFVETKNLFVLRRSSVLFYAYPKRAFAPADLDAFRSLLQRKVVGRT